MPKITELPSDSVPESGDLIPIVDIAGNVTNKMTRANLLAGAPLPADTVDTQAIEDSAVTHTKLAAGVAVQIARTTSSAVATGSTVIPRDDTIPQNTEGDEYMTLTITPKSASNILVIDVSALVSDSGTSLNVIGALFQDSIANALAVGLVYADSANEVKTLNFKHSMVAGTTSPITFKFRAGTFSGTTVTFNGIGGARLFGTTPKSSITITEYKA